MQLVQILLPLTDNRGQRLPRKRFEEVKRELTKRFKGLTAYSRGPAEGLWKPGDGTKREEIVVYEVMMANLDKGWWKRYRRHLEHLFHQEHVVIRSHRVKVL